MSGDLEPTQRNERVEPGDDMPEIPEITLTEEIGRGGMGVVYRGRQEYLSREVAVKLLLVDPNDRDYAARFQREAKILAGLSHPNIVSCYSAGILTDGKPYLVMEFIDGPNLRQWLDKCGAVEPRLALEIMRDLSEALRHGYRSKIIHRDVKPENVLLCRKVSAAVGASFPYEVKLADLGLARSTNREDTAMNLTSSREVLGTPPMMAPEQFDDSFEIDHRADIYGLGCVLYHALTGQFAYTGRSYAAIIAKKQAPRGPDPRNLNPDIPESVAALVTEMLARDPDDRPQTYEVLIRRVDTMITELDSGITHRSKEVVFHDGNTMALPTPPPGAQTQAPTMAGTRTVSVTIPRTMPVLLVGLGLVVMALLVWYWVAGGGPDYQIKGRTSVAEGERIDLWIEGEGIDEPQYRWSVASVASGPKVELPPSTDRLSLEAPNWHDDYAIELAWFVRSNSGQEVSRTVVVDVAAQNDPPVVTLPDTWPTEAGQEVRITAEAVDPEGGAVASYNWTMGSTGSVVVEDVSFNGATMSFTPPRHSEAYRVPFTLIARDTQGEASEPHAIVVEVAAAPEPLVVAAGEDLTLPEGGEGTLQGTTTGGRDGAKIVRWNQRSGPNVLLSSPTSLTTNFRAPSRVTSSRAQTLEFELSVQVGDETVTDQVAVTVVPDRAYAPLTSTGGERVFEPPMVEILKTWRQRGGLDFDKAGANGVMGTGGDTAESTLTREMPRGRWRMIGYCDDQLSLQSPAAHGVELEIVESRRYLRFEVRRREDGGRELFVWEKRGSGVRDDLPKPLRATERLTPDGYLHFRLDYKDGEVDFRFVDLPQKVYKGDWSDADQIDIDATRWPERCRPRLSLFVVGEGEAYFREFELSGL